METSELEEILEGLVETPVKEFKGDCSWDCSIFVKDILAMSNEANGGRIIVGLAEEENGSFTRVGISSTNKDTYIPDEMKDQIGRFADPHVQFNVFFPLDADGYEYVVIEVLPFVEDPVICRRDGYDVYQGRIYHRNKARRVESSAVSSSTALREIIRRSVAQKMRVYKELGFEVSEVDTVKARLDQELDGL